MSPTREADALPQSNRGGKREAVNCRVIYRRMVFKLSDVKVFRQTLSRELLVVTIDSSTDYWGWGRGRERRGEDRREREGMNEKNRHRQSDNQTDRQ